MLNPTTTRGGLEPITITNLDRLKQMRRMQVDSSISQLGLSPNEGLLAIGLSKSKVKIRSFREAVLVAALHDH